MGLWVDVDSHRVQRLADGGVLWEHDAKQPYSVERHMVGPKNASTWTALTLDPLSLSPSLHCDVALGGCGLHGWVTNGRWVDA